MKISDIKIPKNRTRQKMGDINSLAISMATVGMLQPVAIDENNQLIAGMRRIKAAQQLGWTDIDVAIIKNLDDLYSRLRAERDENVCREPFTPSEAVAIAESIRPMEEQAAKERRTKTQGRPKTGVKFAPVYDKGKSGDKTAEAVGMSRPTLEKARAVVQAAQTDPVSFGDLLKQMDTTGKVDKAVKELKKRKAKMVLHQFIVEAPPAFAFSGFAPNTISVCDIYDLKLPNACADMIFTDPPYDDESLPLFARLAEFGAEVLKPGAYLMTYCGKMFLPQVIASLGKHLEYVWTFCVYQPDSNHKIQKHHLFQAWRPIICYKKPGVSVYADWQPDVVKGTRNKDFHEWQQQIEPPLKYISAYTPIGGLVIDPFIGSGTTALACKQTGRNYLGFDKGIDAVRISLSRLQ